MALVTVKKLNDVEGSRVVQVYEFTFTGVTTGQYNTGMSDISSAVFNNETTEGDGLMKKNTDAAGTGAERGGLYFSGFTSGDVVTVEVKGR